MKNYPTFKLTIEIAIFTKVENEIVRGNSGKSDIKLIAQ